MSCRKLGAILAAGALGCACWAEVKYPSVLDPALHLSLIASEPEIVTPIGVEVDRDNRVFVIESHTHFPRTNYSGAKSDRVKVFEIDPLTGKCLRQSIFADGFYHAMNLAFSPEGILYLTYRNGVVKLEDTNHDSVADRRTTILRMETKGNYPHNGIGGITFGADGWLYLGQGENLGEAYTIIGSDGATEKGGGEGGNIFRCRPDGSRLERFATGVWNPFGLTFFERHLLAVDNDPDSRPPCRLIDVVRHGDYGFRFRYGRNGLHPFIAWNGELPGMLPMMAGTGEAPSGILNTKKARLPSRYDNGVLVTSWGDHHLEFYRPYPFGASLKAESEIVISGGEFFRPVGIAAGPDGSIYFSDWVERDYSVHGKGRLWRLSGGPRKGTVRQEWRESPAHASLERLERQKDPRTLWQAATNADPFVQSSAMGRLAELAGKGECLKMLREGTAREKLSALLVLRRSGADFPAELTNLLLAEDEKLRLMATIWAGEKKFTGALPSLDQAIQKEATPLLLRAVSATRNILRGTNSGVSEEFSGEVRIIHVASAPDAGYWQSVAANNRLGLQVRAEAVRYLSELPEARAALAELAARVTEPLQLRLEAAAGGAADVELLPRLIPLLADSVPEMRREAARSLRLVKDHPEVRAALKTRLAIEKDRATREQLAAGVDRPEAAPSDDRGWLKVAEGAGEIAAGRRIFFHPLVGCGNCHRIEDHGGVLGPDLSTIAIGSTTEKLITSILHPSQEMAPQFVAHEIETNDGEKYTGIPVGTASGGVVTMMNGIGTAVLIPSNKIKSDIALPLSLMPEGLEKSLTLSDFSDLIAFLRSRK